MLPIFTRMRMRIVIDGFRVTSADGSGTTQTRNER